jgi:hypothetical protein
MGVWDVFSKREKRKQKAGQEDVYQYDELPTPFRVQVVHILRDTLGRWQKSPVDGMPRSCTTNSLWEAAHSILTKERGVFRLSQQLHDNPADDCVEFILRQEETMGVLDLIEVLFKLIDKHARDITDYERKSFGLSQDPDDAIEELNTRFREHGIGYEYTNRELVRIDSRFVHAEATKPALQLLHSAGREFAGPQAEFMEAHAKYRKGEHKEAILAACHAFESTLKAICTARGWSFNATKDTAVDLLRIVYDRGLVPSHLQNHFNGLRTVLESGSPTVRNKTPGSGHGQGATPVEAPEHVARYALNLAASNIVFLIESHKAMK